MNSQFVRIVVGVVLSVLAGLSFFGLALYSATWGAGVTKWVVIVFIGALLGAVVSFKWEDAKTFPEDCHELFFGNEPEVKTHPEVFEEPRQSGTMRILGGPNAPKSPAPRLKNYHL